ncbi:uncharacterized protein [Dermacentor albipictus]
MDVSSLAPAQPAQPEVPLPPGYERQAAPPAYYGAEAYGAPAPAQPAQPEVPLPPGYERQAAPPAYYGVEAYGAPGYEAYGPAVYDYYANQEAPLCTDGGNAPTSRQISPTSSRCSQCWLHA